MSLKFSWKDFQKYSVVAPEYAREQCWQPNRNRHRNLGFFEKPNLTATEIFVTAT